MSTPVERISRLLNEGARFMVELPGQAAIDLTPDVMAALNDPANLSKHASPCANTDQESSRRDDQRRDVPTGVQIP